MKKVNSKKQDEENLTNKVNINDDNYTQLIKTLSDNIKILQKYYHNHIQTKEKTTKEKINLYFSQITSTIKLLSEEKEKIISKYESILQKYEQKIRTLYSEIFSLKVINTFLENNVELLIKREKEYRLIKEKTGIIIENGTVILNDRKENEIFILRTENSTLKNIITKNEKELNEIKEKFKTEKENYDKQILNLNLKLNQLKYKLNKYNSKVKGQSSSSININTNDTTNPYLKLNFTINNVSNKGNNSNIITNRLNSSSNKENNINMSNMNNLNKNGIRRHFESILLNRKNKKKIIISSEGKYKKLAHCKSTVHLNLKNKMINKLKKITQDETSPNTFHKELNLNNLNVSPIHSKKIFCLTPQNDNETKCINLQTFKKIIDIKKKNKLKKNHNNCRIIKNCLSNRNINRSYKYNGIKVIYQNQSSKSKNNSNIKNRQKRIKKELTYNQSILLINNNSSIPSSNFKIQKISKVIINNKNNSNIVNKFKFIKSPKNKGGNNKRKIYLFSNMASKENINPNKNSLSSNKRQNTINTSINSFKKNI